MSRANAKSMESRLLVEAAEEEALDEETYDLKLLRRLLPYLRPHSLLLGTALAMMPISAIAALFQPLLIKGAIDASLVDHSSEALMRVVGLFAVSIVVEFFTRFAQTYLMQLAGQRSTADLRRHVFRHIQGMSLRYFDRTPVGRIVTRVTNDIDSLTELFASGAVTAIADLLMLTGIIIFMLALDWKLSLVAFAALPPLALAVNLFRGRARESFRSIRHHIARLNAYLAEQVQGVAIVQAFGLEEACAGEYEDINAAYRDANFRSIRYDALLYSVVEAVAAACIAGVLWFASVEASGLQPGVETAAYIGTVVAFYEYIRRFFVPIRDLSTKYTIIQSSLASAERIFSLLDVDEADAPERRDEASESIETRAAIRFEDVRFAYRGGHDVIHGVSFDVNEGEKIAIVGSTGSGKTTLTALLLRLYELEEGIIRVGGEDIRGLDRGELRRRFAVIPQDVFLFSGTLLENICLDAKVDRARASEVLEQVGAWGLVERRGGLDAAVDERGQNFSAGERQLLAFARALYRDADFLILDEATANVDSETEHRLQGAVHRLLEERTAIVIAHRLSTIRDVDRILVMHHGELVEQGSHAELMALDGIYARLYQLQFAE